MRKIVLAVVIFAIAMALSLQNGLAQDSSCFGLRNPINFGSYPAYKGQIGYKPYETFNPLTGVTGMTFYNTIYSNSQLATLSSSQYGCYQSRFRIRSAVEGTDPNTNYNLPYVPDVFTHSIQIGNECTGAEAEALYYDMTVTPDNYLLSLYYAIVIEAPGHGIYADPTFVIRITRDTSATPSGYYVHNEIFGDSSTYMVTSSNVLDGENGWHQIGYGYNAVCYRDWHRASINLYDYMYSRIRIEVMVSDCEYSGHYGYALFAGECQRLELLASDCAAGVTDAVATIKAPRGMASYQWYACNTGVTNSTDTSDFTRMSGRTDSTLYIYAEDFVGGVDGDTTFTERTFLCRLSSSMNPEHPFFFVQTATVRHMKPTLELDSLLECNGRVYLKDNSWVPHLDDNDSNDVDTMLTHWRIYDYTFVDDTLVLDTVLPSVDYELAGGLHAVTVTTYAKDSSCWNEKTFIVDALGVPQSHMAFAPCSYIRYDSIRVVDETPDPARTGLYTTWRQWVVHHATHSDTLVRTGSSLDDRSLMFLGDSTVVRVELWNRTERFILSDTNSDGTADSLYCMGYILDSIVLPEQLMQYDTVCQTLPYSLHGFHVASAQASDTLIRHTLDAHGCDSTVIVALTVHPIFAPVLHDTICYGTDYLDYGFSLTGVQQPTNDTLNLSTVQGCDSIAYLHLAVKPTKQTTILDTICQGNDYDAFGFSMPNVQSSQNLVQNLLTTQNCDSTVTLTLQMNPVYHLLLYDTLCQRENYSSHGFSVVYAQTSDTLEQNLQTIHLCDSVVTLALTVHPVYEPLLFDTLCQGDSYDEYGFAVADAQVSDTMVQHLQSIHHCDSTVTLRLTVHPVYAPQFFDTLCFGGEYVENGFDVRDARADSTYVLSLSTVEGCDSTATLTLKVNPIFETWVDDIACFGENYVGNGFQVDDVRANDTLSMLLSTVNGCDSNVTLALTMMPDPVLSATLQGFLCDAKQFHLTATHTDNVSNVTWMRGETILAEADNLYIAADNATHVVATATVPGTHCQNSIQVDIPAAPSFEARLDVKPAYANHDNKEIMLIDQSTGAIAHRMWLVDEVSGQHNMPGIASWSFLGDNVREQYLFPNGNDSVAVQLIVTENHYNCTDTASFVIPFLGGVTWAPNAFTPTMPTNNIFRVQGNNVVSFQIVIYNRDGIEVFRSSDSDEGWDGTFQPQRSSGSRGALQPGVVCPQGSYVYIVHYTTEEAPRQVCEKRGSVLLLH